MPTLYIRIPEDRIGVVIGPGGRTRRDIADRTKTTVTVDAAEGEVEIASPDTDPMAALVGRDIVQAIGRGFSPPRAFRLLKENTYLAVLDIKFTSGHRDKAGLRRIRARVIGTNGKARARIEDLSGCWVSIYGSTVALIGEEEQLERATRAVEMLLRGSEHATVFHYLARQRRDAAAAEALGLDGGPDAGS
ncbi:MAG TPA: KH domain-containing protein [Thermoplasmata archaeon]|nr:KH domain-containing protein [Thermoplasmata archaeon]